MRKSTIALGAAFLAGASFIMLPGARVDAWTNGSGTCPLGTSDAYWPSGAHPMFRCTNKTFPGFPNSTLPATEKSQAATQAAMAWAHWAWYRDGVTKAWIWLDQQSSHSCDSGSSWVDDGNEINEEWFIPSGCDDDALACEYTDHADCFTSGNNRILATDIVINSSKPWAIIGQNTLSRCLQTTSHSLQNTTLHELGHSYGMKHDDARVSLMNVKPRVRNCNVGANFADYPHPDDFQGYLQYHKNYSGSRFNVAGTPWYKSGSTATKDTIRQTVTASTPAAWRMSYLFHSYYAHSGASIVIAYRAIPTSVTPTFNYTTKQWSNTGTSLFLKTNSTVPGWFTHKITVDLDVFHGELPGNGQYRIWVYVDSTNALSETEEDDNIFPTDVVITRS
jgi:hypothetical protein